MLSQISPSIQTENFVNTSKVEITHENVATHAKNECIIEYDGITSYLDTAECMWKVVFFMQDNPSESQTVYLDYDGKTTLIVFGFD